MSIVHWGGSGVLEQIFPVSGFIPKDCYRAGVDCFYSVFQFKDSRIHGARLLMNSLNYLQLYLQRVRRDVIKGTFADLHNNYQPIAHCLHNDS